MLTWSFGWTGTLEPSSPPAISIARFEMTSFTFMFVWVPEPVCQTNRGKWSSRSPSRISSAAATIRSASDPVEQAAIGVHHRGRLLEQGERADDLHRHPVRGRVADREMVQRALGLGAPVAVGRDLDGPDRVGLGAGVGHRVTHLRRAATSSHVTAGRTCEGAARSGPPPARAYEEGVTYPPGCVTPFTSSVYGAYCVTSCVPSW